MAEDYTKHDPRIVEMNGQPILKGDTQTIGDSTEKILDRDWAKVSFLMSDSRLADYNNLSNITPALRDDIANRYWSSANRKFTDTTFGGNTAVNARPQFNRYSDIRIKGRLKSRKDVSKSDMSGNYGMGRYYSEAIDDNSQTIYMRFGVPQFNSLISFFMNAFNPSHATFINTGRTRGTMYDIASIAGTLFTATSFPVFTGFVVGSRIVANIIFNRPTSKFYTMKPTMFMYWSAVDMMVNSMMVDRGLMPKFPGGDKSTQRMGDAFKYDSDFINKLHQRFPRIFSESGRVDIFSVALRAQSIANKAFLQEYNDLNAGDNFEGYVRGAGDTSVVTRYVDESGEHTFVGFLTAVTKIQSWFGVKDEKQKQMTEPSMKVDPVTGQPKPGLLEDQSGDNPGWIGEFVEYLDAELSQGGAFAVFKVDNTGSVSESFNNSVMESDLSQKLNQSASQMRQLSFTFAGGNIGDDIISNTLEAVGRGIKDTFTGALNGITLGLSGAAEALLQGSYYDIPKTWQSSTANLPKASYTMQLVAPYGHPLSQLQNIYIPLAILIGDAKDLCRIDGDCFKRFFFSKSISRRERRVER